MPKLDQLLSEKQKIAEKMAKLEKAIAVESNKDSIVAEVKTAMGNLSTDAVNLFDENYLIVHKVNGDWDIQVNPVKKGNGNGNGNGNFKGRQVTIPEELKAKYELTELTYPSIRKLALALGIAKDDKHPDQTLKDKFDDVWQAIKSQH
jgi:hypothetical protein